MKKTHQDRVNLIDRLERKYARKVQLRAELRRQSIKNALRAMRGQHFGTTESRIESIDSIKFSRAH